MSDTGNWKTLQDSKKERFDLHLRHGQQGAVRHPRGFPALQEKVSFFHINNSPFTIQNYLLKICGDIRGDHTQAGRGGQEDIRDVDGELDRAETERLLRQLQHRLGLQSLGDVKHCLHTDIINISIPIQS